MRCPLTATFLPSTYSQGKSTAILLSTSDDERRTDKCGQSGDFRLVGSPLFKESRTVFCVGARVLRRRALQPRLGLERGRRNGSAEPVLLTRPTREGARARRERLRRPRRSFAPTRRGDQGHGR